MTIFEAFQQFTAISPRPLQELQQLIVEEKYSKGEHLLRFGEYDKDFFFIVEGSARAYYLRDGTDITDYFALDGQFIGGLESLFQAEPALKAIELTEDSVVQSFNYIEFEKVCTKHHELERLGRKLVTHLFILAQQVVEDLRFLSAAQRYEQLQIRHPGISNRVPLKHIASYLNISIVSLSRIRSGKQ